MRSARLLLAFLAVGGSSASAAPYLRVSANIAFARDGDHESSTSLSYSGAAGHELAIGSRGSVGLEVFSSYWDGGVIRLGGHTTVRQSVATILAGVRGLVRVWKLAFWANLHLGHGRVWGSESTFRVFPLITGFSEPNHDVVAFHVGFGMDLMLTRHFGFVLRFLDFTNLHEVGGFFTGKRLDVGIGLIARL